MLHDGRAVAIKILYPHLRRHASTPWFPSFTWLEPPSPASTPSRPALPAPLLFGLKPPPATGIVCFPTPPNRKHRHPSSWASSRPQRTPVLVLFVPSLTPALPSATPPPIRPRFCHPPPSGRPLLSQGPDDGLWAGIASRRGGPPPPNHARALSPCTEACTRACIIVHVFVCLSVYVLVRGCVQGHGVGLRHLQDDERAGARLGWPRRTDMARRTNDSRLGQTRTANSDRCRTDDSDSRFRQPTRIDDSERLGQPTFGQQTRTAGLLECADSRSRCSFSGPYINSCGANQARCSFSGPYINSCGANQARCSFGSVYYIGMG